MLKFGSSLSMLRSKIIFMKTKKKTGDTAWHVTSFPWSILYGTGKYGFPWNERWYEHVPDTVLENEDYRMLWDFSIRTDHETEARRLDLLVIDQKKEQLQHYRRDNYGQWKMEGCEQKRMSTEKIPKSHKRNSKDVRCKDNDEQGSLGTFWRCKLSKSEVKGTCCWLLAGVDENCIWHLYLRVLAIIIIIINFINFFETGLQIGIAGFVGNTGNI